MDDKLKELKERAEQKRISKNIDISTLSAKDILQLVENLEVYQIELEMQNEELKSVQKDLATAKNKYFALFEFAPVGYIQIDGNFKIIDPIRLLQKFLN